MTALVLWLDDKVFHQLAPEKRAELVAEATASPRSGRWDAHNAVPYHALERVQRAFHTSHS